MISLDLQICIPKVSFLFMLIYANFYYFRRNILLECSLRIFMGKNLLNIRKSRFPFKFSRNNIVSVKSARAM
jgi:hypothetical protein